MDVSFGEPTPSEGEETAIVDGEPARVLSNAQIMSGKLLGRGMTAPGRDLVDIAAWGVVDPEALEVAVNGLDDESANAMLRLYEEMDRGYAKEVGDLEGVPPGLDPVRRDPLRYAAKAIHSARYERVKIRTRSGAGEVETITLAGSRRRRYKDARALQRGMEQNGFNAFLTAQVGEARSPGRDGPHALERAGHDGADRAAGTAEDGARAAAGGRVAGNGTSSARGVQGTRPGRRTKASGRAR